MPLTIQRQPRGLAELLSIFGGLAPRGLEDNARLTLEGLQYFGLAQTQGQSSSNAALAAGGNVTITVPANVFWVVFSLHCVIVRTATQTGLALSLQMGAANAVGTIWNYEAPLYGATQVGTRAQGLMLPYPRLLPPNGVARVSLDNLVGDATANVGVTAVVGVLG